jgi:glyoxylase-like metal-dependent hydrolase (beta-lactamase superfamily II)
MFMENCYLVGSREASEAVLIDPGEEADLFLRRLDHEGLELKQIWLTHGHVDHVDGVQHVVRETGADVFLHPEDRILYDAYAAQRAKYGLQVVDTPPPPDHDLAHGDELRVGEFTFTVRHVPGHSKGGVAFVGHGVAFSGDALFMGSIGRTDLPGGDMDTLLSSIHEQLLSLPDDTIVYPGHGPETTVGTERSTNPFLTGDYGRF